MAKSKRRANGEGCLRQKKDGTWELSFMVGYRADGKRRYKTFSGKTQKEVKAKSAHFREAFAKGVCIMGEFTFSEWADIWFENHKNNISVTTQNGYRYTLRTLKEIFGNKKIEHIRPIDIEAMFYLLREKGYSSSYLAQCRGMMYQIMNKAEANDLIYRNPVPRAEKIRHTDPPKVRDAFTAEEVSRLMRELPDDRMGQSIRLLLGTGMRTQELLALEPRHIAEDGSTICIEQAVKMEKGTVAIGAPKSRDSYRTVPIPDQLRGCAVALRHTDRKYVWEVKKPGSPCNPSYFRDRFKEALKAVSGVRLLTPHSCRHTYVSQLQALGVDLATIQSLVGHADIDMTKHYLHVQENVRLDAARRFGQAFGLTTEPNQNDPEATREENNI